MGNARESRKSRKRKRKRRKKIFQIRLKIMKMKNAFYRVK